MFIAEEEAEALEAFAAASAASTPCFLSTRGSSSGCDRGAEDEGVVAPSPPPPPARFEIPESGPLRGAGTEDSAEVEAEDSLPASVEVEEAVAGVSFVLSEGSDGCRRRRRAAASPSGGEKGGGPAEESVWPRSLLQPPPPLPKKRKELMNRASGRPPRPPPPLPGGTARDGGRRAFSLSLLRLRKESHGARPPEGGRREKAPSLPPALCEQRLVSGFPTVFSFFSRTLYCGPDMKWFFLKKYSEVPAN